MDWAAITIVANVVVTIFSLIVGLLIRSMAAQLKSVLTSVIQLQTADVVMSEKLSNIAIMIAGNYVKREEVREMIDREVVTIRNEFYGRKSRGVAE